MIWYIYILIDSAVNWWMIEKKKQTPFYLPLFLVRAIAAICYGAFFMDVEATLWSTLHWLLTVTLPFPFLFNTLLNTWRHKAIDYMGAESGWIDKWVAEHKVQRLWYWVTLIMFLIVWSKL